MRKTKQKKYSADDFRQIWKSLETHRDLLVDRIQKLLDDVKGGDFEKGWDIRDAAESLASTCFAIENIESCVRLAERTGSYSAAGLALDDCAFEQLTVSLPEVSTAAK